MAKKKGKDKKKKVKETILDGVNVGEMNQEKLMLHLVKDVKQLYELEKQRISEEEERNLLFRRLEVVRENMSKYEADSISQLKNMEETKFQQSAALTKNQFSAQSRSLRLKKLDGNFEQQIIHDVLHRVRKGEPGKQLVTPATVYRQRVNYLRYVLERELDETKMEQSQFLKDCAASHAEVLHEASVRRLDLRLRHKEERKAYEQNTKESILKADKQYQAAEQNYAEALEDQVANLQADREEIEKDAQVETQTYRNLVNQKRLEHLVHLQRNFEKNYQETKQYFLELTHHNLTMIEDMRNQAKNLKEHLNGLYARFHDVQNATKLSEKPVQMQAQRLVELKKQASIHSKEITSLQRINQNMEDLEKERCVLMAAIRDLHQEYAEIEAAMKTVRGDYLGGIVEAKQVLGADANVMRKKAALLYNKLEASKSGLMRTVGSKNNHNAAENLRELEMFEHQFSRNETIRKDMELTVWKLAKLYSDSITIARYIVEKYELPVAGFLQNELFTRTAKVTMKLAEIGRVGMARDILSGVL